ncbi:PE-PGRS family domain protein [Mycobacterium kansasii 732]|nr:PE-PGRS family domain protein [Mycobacterium kansasii 732]
MPDWATCPFHRFVMDSFEGKSNWSCQSVTGVVPVLVIV